MESINTDEDGALIVKYNSFLDAERIAVKLTPGQDSAGMIATENFWNTTDDVTIRSMIYDKNDDLACAGYIPYQPILARPHPDTPTSAELPLSADFIASKTRGCEPLEVQFTQRANGVVNSFLWNFGDGQTSTLSNPIHTYADQGSYTVSLTVTGPEGSDIDTRIDFILVNPAMPLGALLPIILKD